VSRHEIASNEFVKVGGLLGVDTTYRLNVDLLSVAREHLAVSQKQLELMQNKTVGGFNTDSPFDSVPIQQMVPLNITPGRRAGT
jgi:hypothetical protein